MFAIGRPRTPDKFECIGRRRALGVEKAELSGGRFRRVLSVGLANLARITRIISTGLRSERV